MDQFGLDIAEIGAMGVILFLFVGLLRWIAGSVTKALDSLLGALDSIPRALEQNATVIAESQSEVQLELRTLMVAIVSLQKMLLAHDLTVRGLNPSAGGDLDERTNQAVRVYQDLQTALEEQLRILAKPRSAS